MPTAVADRRVLLQHAAAAGRVLDRHLPAAEVGQLGAERDVPVVQRRVQQIGHRGQPIAAPAYRYGIAGDTAPP